MPAQSEMAPAAIEARGLERTFKGGVDAVRGIDLSVAAGEVFGFLGPNGAGKTTTVRMLCTLLPPTSGSASVAGIDVVADPAEIRRRIGVAPQEIGLDPIQTGRELLELPRGLYGITGADARGRREEPRRPEGAHGTRRGVDSARRGGRRLDEGGNRPAARPRSRGGRAARARPLRRGRSRVHRRDRPPA